MKQLITLIFLLAITGCSTVHFKNGNVAGSGSGGETWHHNFALSLYEATPPVNLSQRCNGKAWSVVTTERTFINGLAGSVDNLAVGLDIWDPWTARVQCGN